jgi:hypothetical protein
MLGWVLRAITAASAVALFLPAPANALTATGVAVGFVGSSVEVGLTENRPLLGNQEAIEYFIPLKDNNGTYGVGSNKCGGTGFGTCADSGDGGGLLTMILRSASR